jgi:hypothetical protein
MPIVLAPGDIVEVTPVCQDSEQISENKTHWIVSANPGGFTDQAVAAAFDAANGVLFKPILAPLSIYYGTSVQRISPLPKRVLVSSKAAQGPGTSVNPQLPRQTALVVPFKTAFPGKQQRGRMYLPFPPAVGNINGGIPALGYLVNAQAIATAYSNFITFGALLVTVTLSPVVFHRKTNTFDFINPTTSLNQKWATQRRRGSYGRPNVPPF